MQVIKLLLTVLSLSQVSYGYTLKRVECTANPSICADKVCHFNYTRDEPKVYHLFLGCSLKETITKLSLRISSSYRSGKQFVAVRAMETLIDVCDIAQISSNTMLQTFAPQIIKQFSNIFSGCPYSVCDQDKFMIHDMILHGGAMPNLLGKKDTKSELTFSKGKFLPMFTVTLYGTSI